VRFLFRCFAQPGVTTILATVCNVSGSWTLWIREAQRSIESVTIEVSETNIDPGDSVLINICAKDSNSVGIPGLQFIASATGGRLEQFPPTDSIGCSHACWWPGCCGMRCMLLHFGTWSDSVCVFVDSL
jgi:hypothetical protein